MDIWNIVEMALPFVVEAFPAVGGTIAGASVVASVWAKPKSQFALKAHKLINLLGFNFGKAKNAE